jgi:hypothetical protein
MDGPRGQRVRRSAAVRRTATAASNAAASIATVRSASSRGVLLPSSPIGVAIGIAKYVWSGCAVACAANTCRAHLRRDSVRRTVARSRPERVSQNSTPINTINKRVRAHAPPAVPRTRYETQRYIGEVRRQEVHRRREYSANPPMSLAVASAPLATSSRATSYWPCSAAQWSGVHLRCKHARLSPNTAARARRRVRVSVHACVFSRALV